jgi:hypothetical protein
MKPVREPDDRNGHVRFDERAPETELWRGLRHRRSTRKRPETATPHDLLATAPVLDSTTGAIGVY